MCVWTVISNDFFTFHISDAKMTFQELHGFPLFVNSDRRTWLQCAEFQAVHLCAFAILKNSMDFQLLASLADPSYAFGLRFQMCFATSFFDKIGGRRELHGFPRLVALSPRTR